MNQYVFRGILIVILIPLIWFFYATNAKNYALHRDIQKNLVNHPEKVPQSQAAKISSFGFQNMMADMYWLQTIQYIGANVIGGEYKKYLFVMMDLITDLDPYFESPYVIGQLLLPASGDTYEERGVIHEGVLQGEALGLKGVKNFCNEEIMLKIRGESNLQKIISSPEYANPCKSYKIPYYLAYIHFFYTGDLLEASQYYKIVSAQTDAPEGAKILAAIMQGKSGQREKSLFMFLSLAKSSASENESCTLLTQELEKTYSFIHTQNLPLTGKLIQDVEYLASQVLPAFSNETEDEVLSETQCSGFLVKAIRELNLLYLEQADSRYIADNPHKTSAGNPQTLFDAGYIDFIPTDYQQHPEGYGIIYEYNQDIGKFDYTMSY